MDEDLKKIVTKEVSLGKLPFVAKYWNFSIEDRIEQDVLSKIKLGKFNAQMQNSYPFYKSFSKLINLGIIKNDIKNGS